MSYRNFTVEIFFTNFTISFAYQKNLSSFTAQSCQKLTLYFSKKHL